MAKIPLRNLLSLIQKRFLHTHPTLSSISKPRPSSSALPLSKRLIIPRDAAPESLSLFKNLESYGFNTTQIATLVEKSPEIVHSRFNSKFKPRLEYLIEKGFKGGSSILIIQHTNLYKE
ncbi:hypothetical protein PVK06_036189 [Gossypium arboreum]|uniref:Uncharacterized protein n=1 Tax=Gossypium arboreum TaxID=29729 RepID=A0ABR0NIV2_GOSAR|nr:hypothetical protein PVK06_036189 [Gossypium arboreum]